MAVRSLGMLPESVQCENSGFASQNRNGALLQPTCWAKDILLHLYRNCMISSKTNRMNVGWSPFRAGFEEFSTEKNHEFTTVQRVDGNV